MMGGMVLFSWREIFKGSRCYFAGSTFEVAQCAWRLITTSSVSGSGVPPTDRWTDCQTYALSSSRRAD